MYEYHPLFRTFLLAQAGRSYSVEQLVDLRRRAAHLADSAALSDTAVALLADGEDWPG
jgi:ATP/maltotriose-dependent transcriptional regulator MalT